MSIVLAMNEYTSALSSICRRKGGGVMMRREEDITWESQGDVVSHSLFWWWAFPCHDQPLLQSVSSVG